MAIKKGVSRVLDVNREPSRPKKRRKITLSFDEDKRREFLTGFRKRKLQRKEKAQEELKKKLAEERKRVKQEVREKYKKLLSHRDIPELEELLSKHEYEDGGKTVSILELNVNDLTRNSCIGENRSAAVKEEDDDEEEDDEEDEDDDRISGMELKQKPVSVKEEPVAQISKHDLQKEIKKMTRISKVPNLRKKLDKQKKKKLTLKQKQKREDKAQKQKKKKNRKKTR